MNGFQSMYIVAISVSFIIENFPVVTICLIFLFSQSPQGILRFVPSGVLIKLFSTVFSILGAKQKATLKKNEGKLQEGQSTMRPKLEMLI